MGIVPGANVVEDGRWRMLWGAWQRTTKNEYHAGWVDSMIPSNTRPPLSPEENRARLGRFAYKRTRSASRSRSRLAMTPGRAFRTRLIPAGSS